jgi:hypothetical protein
MTTLTDRLQRLAQDAPDAGHATGDDGLWDRGRRLQRRRRAVTASLAVVLVLGLGSLTTLVVGVVDPRPVAVADADAALRLPDRFYDPGPWTPGVEETGPIGPLVALFDTERRTFWGESSTGIIGVSSSGEYAFLPLSGSAQVANGDVRDPRLSPDGRYVAYAVTGETRDEPNDLDGPALVGVGVYDTVTGETSEQLVPTDHGLAVENVGWIGDFVVMEYSQYDTFERTEDGYSTTSVDPGALRWDPSTDDLADTVSPREVPDLYDTTPVPDGLVLPDGQRRFSVVDVEGAVLALGEVDTRIEGRFLVSPDGTRVAGREDPDPAGTFGFRPSAIVVADLSGPRAGVTRDVVVSGGEPVAWRGDDHLVVVADDRRDGDYAGLVSVDVDTGETEPLLDVQQGVFGFPQVAYDAWSAPMLAAPEPDRPGDPRRMVWLGGGLVLLLAGAAFWRSRVRL